MIYTDGMDLFTDVEVQELHDFAHKIGLKRVWFEERRGIKPACYPVWGLNLVAAVNAGAKCVRHKELMEILNKKAT